MFLVSAILLLFCFALLVSHYWKQLFSVETQAGVVPFARWVGKGLVLPSLIWILLNCGLAASFPPLSPAIAHAKSAGGDWITVLSTELAPGLLAIGTFWAAISFAHLSTVIGIHADPRRDYALMAGTTSALSLPAAIVLWIAGGLPWLGTGLLLWLLPLTHLTLSFACRPKEQPLYSRAIAHMKFGKYQQAEKEVLTQLEKCETDFDGWLMLAELYATRFDDLPEAERTLQAVCTEPGVTSLQVSIAFHKLADWYLNADNPLGARRALEEIRRRLPGGHFARMAQLRSQQLPSTREEWIARKTPARIPLPALASDLEPSQEQQKPKLDRSEAARLARECVEQLQRNPNTVPPREKLALLFAEELGKLELGIEQLDLLLEMTGQPDEKKAAWLSQAAAWQWRYLRDGRGARVRLEQLIARYPESAQAFAAQRWLNLLEMEERAHPQEPHFAERSSPEPPDPL